MEKKSEDLFKHLEKDLASLKVSIDKKLSLLSESNGNDGEISGFVKEIDHLEAKVNERNKLLELKNQELQKIKQELHELREKNAFYVKENKAQHLEIENLLNTSQRKEDELRVATKRIVEKNQEDADQQKVVEDLDKKVKEQLIEIGELKEALLEANKIVKHYNLELKPLKSKVIELSEENKAFKINLSSAEKDKRKLFLDVSEKEAQLASGDPYMVDKFKAYQEEHERRLKTVVDRYTQEHIVLASQIERLKRAITSRDKMLKDLGRMQQEVANRLLK